MTRVLGDVEAVSEAFTSGLFAVVPTYHARGRRRGDALARLALGVVTFSIVPALFVRRATSASAPATPTGACGSGSRT